MTCPRCGAKAEKSLTVSVRDFGENLLIIRNVPCYKCIECTEVLYRGDVVEKLHEIRKKAKTSPSELSVVDYNKIVA